MIFQNYSWQDFSLGATLLLVLWYLGFYLHYRKKKVLALKDSQPLSHGWQHKVDALSSDQEVMGRTKPDYGVSVVEAEGFRFAQSPEKEQQLGLVPDIQQEIKSICSLLAEKDGTKEDFFAMFAMLVKDRYAGVPEGIKGTLNAFIREHVPFHLSSQELEQIWE